MPGPENASRLGDPRALSLRGQLILLGAVLLIGTGAVVWILIQAIDSVAIWRIAALAGATLAVLVLSVALAWRLVAQCLGILDDLVLALERVANGDLSQRLEEDGSAELRRVACAFNLAVQNSARRADDLKQSSLKRLQAAVELRESRELATAIQETALDSIITIDSRGKILAFNAAAEATFGFKAAQAIGQDIASLIVPERLREPYRRGLAHYLKKGEGPILGKRVEMPALRASGDEFPVEVAIVANPLRGSWR
jgi:PAS domain S-box-containing protein